MNDNKIIYFVCLIFVEADRNFSRIKLKGESEEGEDRTEELQTRVGEWRWRGINCIVTDPLLFVQIDSPLLAR